jgi:predicted AAA+ superfamily ATPase
MEYIHRNIEKKIKEGLFKGKLIIVYGARRVGKTTLAKKILADYSDNSQYFDCETLAVERGLSELDPDKIKTFFGNRKLVVLDEAQNIPDIGRILKIMVDTYPEIQIIATGSSSFDLAQKISEPMTGRTYTFVLYPLSLAEIKEYKDMFFVESKLENILRFGSYPMIFDLGEDAIRVELEEVVSKYLYKDVLRFEGLGKSAVIKNLLRLLALQLGSEVSYNELATQLGIGRLTVQKYIDILQQSFVVFRLEAFARNRRKEISKSVKIYFYDLGVRNTLIENYNRMEVRNDAGALWENLCVIERMKTNAANTRFVNSYFWRTYDKKEVDYVEEGGGKITGFEFKWNEKKPYNPPREFVEGYNATVEKIDKSNYWKFLI